MTILSIMYALFCIYGREVCKIIVIVFVSRDHQGDLLVCFDRAFAENLERILATGAKIIRHCRCARRHQNA